MGLHWARTHLHPKGVEEGVAAQLLCLCSCQCILDCWLHLLFPLSLHQHSSAASGLLLEALAALLPLPAPLQQLLRPRTAPSQLPMASGRQDIPDFSSAAEAPLCAPMEKLGAKLQAAGEALFSEDEPVQSGALYGAYVLSKRAHAALLAIDPAPALAMPGGCDVGCE